MLLPHTKSNHITPFTSLFLRLGRAAAPSRYTVPADEGRAGLACFAPTSESLVAGGANAMLYLWDLGSAIMGRVAEMPPSANSGTIVPWVSFFDSNAQNENV